MHTQLKEVFGELDTRITAMNQERDQNDGSRISKTEVMLLGQMSLLANEKVSAILSLAQTGDLDALLKTEHAVKHELKKILKRRNLLYDEDSHLIWIPPGATFDKMFDFQNVSVQVIDPESALVSKAVKAPEKNKQLIREAIASEKFPGLVDRLLKNGGRLEDFI